MTAPALFIPAWQDSVTLQKNLCISASTVDNWVAQGVIPPPRKRGGKLMWKWEEVDAWLTDGRAGSPDAEAEEIRNAVRRIAAEGRAGH